MLILDYQENEAENEESESYEQSENYNQQSNGSYGQYQNHPYNNQEPEQVSHF
jgi:hypothetical protein